MGGVVADYSEEDENLRLWDPRSAKTSACTRGRSCLRGGCIGKRTEFPAAFCGSSGARSLRFSLHSGRTEQRTPPLPFLMAHCLPHKASCYSPKQQFSSLGLTIRPEYCINYKKADLQQDTPPEISFSIYSFTSIYTVLIKRILISKPLHKSLRSLFTIIFTL